jgi:hypothetical protein
LAIPAGNWRYGDFQFYTRQRKHLPNSLLCGLLDILGMRVSSERILSHSNQIIKELDFFTYELIDGVLIKRVRTVDD